jgi:hypothetical protein
MAAPGEKAAAAMRLRGVPVIDVLPDSPATPGEQPSLVLEVPLAARDRVLVASRRGGVVAASRPS